MKTKKIFLYVLTVLLLSTASVHSEELRYLGRDVQDASKGWIAMQGQYYHVVVGTLISGWGTVTEITDSHLVVERKLPEPEIENLRQQRAAVYDSIRIEIPHDGLRVVPAPGVR